MIDNVRFSTKDIDTLLEVSFLFLSLCKQFSIKVNEEEKYTEEYIRENGNKSYIFLGENFLEENKKVKNTDSNLMKLEKAMKILNTDPTNLTYKNLISILALILFLCHTLFSPSSFFFSYAQFFSLLRMMSGISSAATKKGWSEKIKFINENRLSQLNEISNKLLENKEVKIFPLIRPSLNNNDYFALVICDASASGWGAYIFFPSLNSSFCLKKLWSNKFSLMKHSAAAEPRALNCCISFVKDFFKKQNDCNNNKRIAVVTDHAAVVYGQRQWFSFYGGFSLSFFLNSLFLNSYSDGFATEFFYVAGELNPADGPSRDPSNSLSLSVSPSSFCFPSLSLFYHPFITREKPQYMI